MYVSVSGLLPSYRSVYLSCHKESSFLSSPVSLHVTYFCHISLSFCTVPNIALYSSSTVLHPLGPKLSLSASSHSCSCLVNKKRNYKWNTRFQEIHIQAMCFCRTAAFCQCSYIIKCVHSQNTLYLPPKTYLHYKRWEKG